MQWFNKLSIKKKFLFSFLLLATISFFVGLLTLDTVQDIFEVRHDLEAKVLEPTSSLVQINSNLNKLVIIQNSANSSKNINAYQELLSDIDKAIAFYEKGISTDEEKSNLSKFKEAIANLKSSISGNTVDKTTDAGNTAIHSSLEASLQSVEKLFSDKIKAGHEERELLREHTMHTVYGTTIGTIVILFFAVFIGLHLSKVISNPIKNLAITAGKIQSGEYTNELQITHSDEIGELQNAFGLLSEKIKYTANIAESIAGGNLNIAIEANSKDPLLNSLSKMVTNLQSMSDEISNVVRESIEGNLEVKCDPNKAEGIFKDILSNQNSLLKAIVTPIKDGIAVLKIMTTGDLTAKMLKEYRGDHKLLKQNINQLGDSLSHLLSEVQSNIQRTVMTTNEINSATEEMAAGAQEQSTQVNEISMSVEQMSLTVMDSSRSAGEALIIAQDAGNEAKAGNDVVAITINDMKHIAVTVKDAALKVNELGKSSNEISNIIQVIDDIADQTNLLALNAAIEAARAGEAGRGFAVVADEVRKLSERTTRATKEIATLIKQIQFDTTNAVNSMDVTAKEVDSGVDYAIKAEAALKSIILSSNKVVDVISSLAAASEEQSSSAQMIAHSIEGIGLVANESAKAVQDIAHASGELTDLAETLNGAISRFKINVSSLFNEY